MKSPVFRLSIVAVALLLASCERQLRREGELEYVVDGTQVSLDRQRFGNLIDSGGATLHDGKDSGEVPPNWRPIFSFIHVSDVQLRDYAIHYKGPVEEKVWRAFSGATVREKDLDQNDEYPFALLIGGINEQVRADVQRAAKHLPPLAPMFLIHTGDTVDSGTVGELYRFLSIANRLLIPWYNVVGNHDVFLMGNFTESDIDFHDLPTEGIPLLINRNKFIYLHGADDYGTVLLHQPTAAPRNGMPASQYHGFDCLRPDCRQFIDAAQKPVVRPYYSMRFNVPMASNGPLSIRLIVLDTNVQHGDVPHAGRLELPAYGARGYIDPEQFAWLKRELVAAQGSGDVVLMFGHHTLFTPPSASVFEMLGDLRGTDPSGNRDFPIKDLLRRYPNVVAYFAGHTHVARMFRPGDKGLVEITAPSLHEYPQLGYRVTLYEHDHDDKMQPPRLGLLVQAVQGRVPQGSPAADAAARSCKGARADWLRHNKNHPPEIPTADCFENLHQFFPDIGDVPRPQSCAGADDPAPEPTGAVSPMTVSLPQGGHFSLRGILKTVREKSNSCYDFVMSPMIAGVAEQPLEVPPLSEMPLNDFLEEITRRLGPVELSDGTRQPVTFHIDGRNRIVRFDVGEPIRFEVGDFIEYRYEGKLLPEETMVREQAVGVEHAADGSGREAVVRQIDVSRAKQRPLSAIVTTDPARSGPASFIRARIRDTGGNWRPIDLATLESRLLALGIPHHVVRPASAPSDSGSIEIKVGRADLTCQPLSSSIVLSGAKYEWREAACPSLSWPNATGTIGAGATPPLRRSIGAVGNAFEPAQSPP